MTFFPCFFFLLLFLSPHHLLPSLFFFLFLFFLRLLHTLPPSGHYAVNLATYGWWATWWQLSIFHQIFWKPQVMTVKIFPARSVAGQRWEVVPSWNLTKYSSFTKRLWVFAAAVIVLVSWIERGETVMTLSSWTDSGNWEARHSLDINMSHNMAGLPIRVQALHCHHSYTDLISVQYALFLSGRRAAFHCHTLNVAVRGHQPVAKCWSMLSCCMATSRTKPWLCVRPRVY